MRPAYVWVLTGVALAVFGCGEDREETTGTGTTTTGTATQEATAPRGPVVATVRVSETEYRLKPANPEIEKAGVVRFVARNDGQVAHALEVEGPKGEVETEEFGPGESRTLKADLSEPGSYVWYCPVADHKERGMEGKVTVAGGGGDRTETETETEREDTGGAGY